MLVQNYSNGSHKFQLLYKVFTSAHPPWRKGGGRKGIPYTDYRTPTMNLLIMYNLSSELFKAKYLFLTNSLRVELFRCHQPFLTKGKVMSGYVLFQYILCSGPNNATESECLGLFTNYRLFLVNNTLFLTLLYLHD